MTLYVLYFPYTAFSPSSLSFSLLSLSFSTCVSLCHCGTPSDVVLFVFVLLVLGDRLGSAGLFLLHQGSIALRG